MYSRAARSRGNEQTQVFTLGAQGDKQHIPFRLLHLIDAPAGELLA